MDNSNQDYNTLDRSAKQEYLAKLCEESVGNDPIFLQLEELLKQDFMYDEYTLDSLHNAMSTLLDKSKKAQHRQMEGKISLLIAIMLKNDEDEENSDDEEIVEEDEMDDGE